MEVLGCVGGCGFSGFVELYFLTDKNFHQICEPVSTHGVCPELVKRRQCRARDETKGGLLWLKDTAKTKA